MKKLIAFALLICITLSLSGCVNTSRTTSLDDYLQPAVPMIWTEFLLFPVRADLEKCTVNQYCSESVSTLLFDDAYILLSCTYTRQQYEEEITRFEGIGAHYREDLFRFPGYVAVFDPHSYEYALLDEEHLTITYIAAYTVDFSTESTNQMLKNFPAQFAPVKTDGVDIHIYDYGKLEGEIRLRNGERYTFFVNDKFMLNGIPAKTASFNGIVGQLEPCELSIPDYGQIGAAIAAAYYGADALQKRTANWTSGPGIGVVYNETADVWIVHGQHETREDPGEAWAVALKGDTGKVLGFCSLSPPQD